MRTGTTRGAAMRMRGQTLKVAPAVFAAVCDRWQAVVATVTNRRRRARRAYFLAAATFVITPGFFSR